MPMIFTKPPAGIAPISYDVSLFFGLNLKSAGGKKSEKRVAFMPTALAAMKCPHSCRITSAANATNAMTHVVGNHDIEQKTQSVQNSFGDRLAGLDPCLRIDVRQLRKVSHGAGCDGVQGAFDHFGDREEWNLFIKESS